MFVSEFQTEDEVNIFYTKHQLIASVTIQDVEPVNAVNRKSKDLPYLLTIVLHKYLKFKYTNIYLSLMESEGLWHDLCPM